MKSLNCYHSNAAIQQYFPVMVFITLYNVVLTFESVDEILECDHSNESCLAVLSCGTVYLSVFCKINVGIDFFFSFEQSRSRECKGLIGGHKTPFYSLKSSHLCDLSQTNQETSRAQTARGEC